MASEAATATENPLAEGLERLPIHPTTLVIFGATGDLTHRKLLPGIYNLAHEGSLPERFSLVAFARREYSDDAFRDLARDSITRFSRRPPDPAVLDSLLARITYTQGNFDEAAAYERLDAAVEELDTSAGLAHNRVYYLSTAPEFFPEIVEQLREVKLHRRREAETRIVVEKPFGVDLASARKLNRTVLRAFRERQVYRIDHYLGKETVQNMLALRFANTMFEPVWNRNYVDHVQITAAEDIGIEGRAGYYDSAGALRDLVQNHMLALMSLLCMEPPASLDAEQVRDEKAKVLRAIFPPKLDEVADVAVRGQYTAGVGGGKPVPGYLEEPDVPPGSRTETYAAIRLEVSNWRWAGVPFYLRTGKRLGRKVTEIAVTLKPVPHLAFRHTGSVGVQPNQLIFTVQPDEGVSLALGAKIPGPSMRIRPVHMEFRYGTAFLSQSPEAYERLIMDAMRGDPTLFTRDDQVDASWEICDPILEAWANSDGAPAPYAAGSGGPAEAAALLAGGAVWRRI